MVVLYTLTLSKGQGVVAVRENDGEQLVLVVNQVAAMDVSDGNLVLTPKCRTVHDIWNTRKQLISPTLSLYLSLSLPFFPSHASHLIGSLETVALHFSMKSL